MVVPQGLHGNLCPWYGVDGTYPTCPFSIMLIPMPSMTISSNPVRLYKAFGLKYPRHNTLSNTMALPHYWAAVSSPSSLGCTGKSNGGGALL